MVASPSDSQISDPRVIVALDFPNRDSCVALVEQLDPKLCRVKVGKEMFTALGPGVVEDLQKRGFDVFLDLKFHDIPNTVAKACQTAASLGVWMVNVHASGGERMLDAARESISDVSSPPVLIAVTVLTSMTEADLSSIGIRTPIVDRVELLAKLARNCGLDGVVCSPHEASVIKLACGLRFLTVTPGVRPAGSDLDDQRRVKTPAEAIQDGSDYLVIGRPITAAAAPGDALRQIAESIVGGTE